MAKKNLSSLMDGILGNTTPPEHQNEDKTAEPDSTRRGAGRPKKGEVISPNNDVRATFIGDRDVMKKLKYIAFAEDSMLRDVIDKAFKAFIANWESEKGKITLPGK